MKCVCSAQCVAGVFLVATWLSAAAGAAKDTAPATASKADKWEKEIQAFEAADRKSPPPPGAVLFIGSSGVRKWTTLAADFPEHQVINRGFGGSHIADSVRYAERIVIPYQPRLIVFRAGGNDIDAGKSPETVLADFQAFVTKVQAKLPATRILFMSINPSPKRWEHVAKEKEANRLIEEYVSGRKNLGYIDSFTPMLGADGKPRPELYAEDRLHNSPEGYKLWVKIVRPYLK